MHSLRGATIDPAVASEILASARNGAAEVAFDGFGRITGFATPHLSPALLAKLEAAVIRPLTTTNSPAPREAPRTEREILTRAMHLLGLTSGLAKDMLLDDAKNLFLSGSLNRQSVAAFIDKGVRLLAGDVLLQDQFMKLAAEIAKPVTTTQQADNIYGRSFESQLASDLVSNPPPGVLDAASQLGKGILDTLREHPQPVQDMMLARLAASLGAEPRPWSGQSPSLQTFINQPTMKNLEACLADTSNGIEAIKMPFIATRLAMTINWAVGRGLAQPPQWLNNANNFYGHVISPQKPTEQSRLNGLHVQTPGNWLNHHPKPDTILTGDSAYSWTHAKMSSAESLSAFESHALSTGQTVVNGPSGTTNLMAFFGQHLARRNPNFPEANHHLNTLMFVVFDGGHSTQEVLSTLDAIKKLSQGQSAQDAVGQFAGGYAAIAELGATEAERHELRARLDKATAQTVQYLATHVA